MNIGRLVFILGHRRVMILAATFAALCILALFYYLYLLPQITKMEDEFLEVRRNISAIEDVITGHRSAFEAFSDQRAAYEEIREKGFFDPHNRLELANLFPRLQHQSGALDVRYDIAPATQEEFEKAGQIARRMVKTDISIEVDAFMDQNIMALIKALKSKVSGHIKIRSMTLQRLGTLDEETLADISDGEKPVLVRGIIRAEWRSLVPVEQEAPQDDSEDVQTLSPDIQESGQL